jgi:hypothetical protein
MHSFTSYATLREINFFSAQYVLETHNHVSTFKESQSQNKVSKGELFWTGKINNSHNFYINKRYVNLALLRKYVRFTL